MYLKDEEFTQLLCAALSCLTPQVGVLRQLINDSWAAGYHHSQGECERGGR